MAMTTKYNDGQFEVMMDDFEAGYNYVMLSKKYEVPLSAITHYLPKMFKKLGKVSQFEDAKRRNIKSRASARELQSKAVINITTGMKFDSESKAAKFMGVHKYSIIDACEGNTKHCANQVLRYQSIVMSKNWLILPVNQESCKDKIVKHVEKSIAEKSMFESARRSMKIHSKCLKIIINRPKILSGRKHVPLTDDEVVEKLIGFFPAKKIEWCDDGVIMSEKNCMIFLNSFYFNMKTLHLFCDYLFHRKNIHQDLDFHERLKKARIILKRNFPKEKVGVYFYSYPKYIMPEECFDWSDMHDGW